MQMLVKSFLSLMYLLCRSSALICSLKSYRLILRQSPAIAMTPTRMPKLAASSTSFEHEPFPESGEPCDLRGRPITGAPGSLELLCSVSLRACHLMTPLIAAVYHQLLASSNDHNKRIDQSNGSSTENKCGSSVKKLKSDNSAFTIADGLVQRLLIEVLFSRVTFRDIVGEEGEEKENGDGTTPGERGWFEIEGLLVPPKLRPLLDYCRSEIDLLAATYLSDSSDSERNNYQSITIFIDPIDGTKEFSSGKGEQCSICIGFSDQHGRAVGGVIYRPLSQSKPTWIAGAKCEGFAICEFGKQDQIPLKSDHADEVISADNNHKEGGSLLTTNGSVSKFVESLNEELNFKRLKSGGAGNKIMMLLEKSILGSNDRMLYIQDRGVSRWDTCAAEACLESFGGKLIKLTHFTESKDAMLEKGKQKNNCELYTYLASTNNLDFISGKASLTKYNCRVAMTHTIDPSNHQKALDADQVKPYSNLCGLVALGKEWNTKEGITYIKEAIARAATRNPPSFD